MISIAPGQIDAWLALYLWPFVRIGACLMVAPMFGAAFVPPRARIVLAGGITLVVAPLLPVVEGLTPFSAAGFIVTAQQAVIGVAIGFMLQVVFDALSMGGQLLSNSMGLSFAFNVDPLRGASTPVIGQFYMLLVTLTFLALNGHLTIIEMLVEGFTTLPVGTAGLGGNGLWTVASWGDQIFRGSLAVALPGVTALLIVNLGFGVVSRAAPTLNLFAIGFPVTLVCGLAIIFAGLPSVQAAFMVLMEQAFMAIATMLAAGG
jgi:flagellar biosynthesis protein FliR